MLPHHKHIMFICVCMCIFMYSYMYTYTCVDMYTVYTVICINIDGAINTSFVPEVDK